MATARPWSWLSAGIGSEMLFSAAMAQAARARARRAAWWERPDAASWRRRRAGLRRILLGIFGPFPPRCALDPQTTGTLHRDGYRIELVRFRARPGDSITANLYLPTAPAARAAMERSPAVLLACGHCDEGKTFAPYQALAIALVRRGLVVLCYDPIGQGERAQCWDPVRRRGSGIAVYEHIALDRALAPSGGWIGTWMVHDAMGALDYLETRPEVDARKMGMTGHSGGGTQTVWAAAVEPRLRAAAPLCALTTIEARLRSREPTDAEQNPPNFLAHGLEVEEALAMLWPHPLAIGAARDDFFPIAGTRASAARLRRLYADGGAAQGARLFEVAGGHDLSPGLSSRVADWFAASFGLKPTRGLSRVVPESPAALLVTRSGTVLEEAGERWAFARIAAASAVAERADRAALRRVLALPRTHRVRVSRRPLAEVSRVIELWRVTSEPGITVPAALLPARGEGAFVLWASDGGFIAETAAAGPLERLRAAGHHVLACDVRDIGCTRGQAHGHWSRYAQASLLGPETLPLGVTPWRDPDYDGLYGTGFEHAMTAEMLGRPLLGQRVHDLLAVLAAARRAGVVGRRPVVVVGSGTMAFAALYAAALAIPAVAGVALLAPLASYRLLASEPFGAWGHEGIARGILRAGDIPQALALVRSALVIDPLDARGGALSAASAARVFAPAKHATLRWRRDGVDPDVELSRFIAASAGGERTA